MIDLVEDREQLEDILLGVELTCFFAFVGLGMFAAGWIKSRSVHAEIETDSALGAIQGSSMIVAQTFEPVPSWVRTGLLIAVAVLLVAVAIDVYLLLEDDEVDVRQKLQEMGEAE